MGGEVFVALFLPPPCAYQRPKTTTTVQSLSCKSGIQGILVKLSLDTKAERIQLLGPSERWRRIDLFVFPQPNKVDGGD